MSIVVNRTGFDIKLSEIAQPEVYRLGAFRYSLKRIGPEEELNDYYIDVYISGYLIMRTQENEIDLKTIIYPIFNKQIEIKFIQVKVVGDMEMSSEPLFFIDRNMVVRWSLLCNNNSIIQK